MICLILRVLTMGRKSHRWGVAWNDDDVCLRSCGAIRNFPSGHIAQPWRLSREDRRISRANARAA